MHLDFESSYCVVGRWCGMWMVGDMFFSSRQNKACNENVILFVEQSVIVFGWMGGDAWFCVQK